MSEINKTRYRRFIEEVLNRGNLALVADYHVPEFVDHRHPESSGIEGTRKFLGDLRTSFPDLHVNLEDIIAEGDRVVVRLTIRGTHKGEFMGVAPTGRHATWSAINIARYVDGKVIELWGEADLAGLMRQLRE